MSLKASAALARLWIVVGRPASASRRISRMAVLYNGDLQGQLDVVEWVGSYLAEFLSRGETPQHADLLLLPSGGSRLP